MSIYARQKPPHFTKVPWWDELNTVSVANNLQSLARFDPK